MIGSFDVTCAHCGAVVRVIEIAYGVVDEKKQWDCPECRSSLFSWEGARVYDIERVVQHGSTFIPSSNSKPAPGA